MQADSTRERITVILKRLSENKNTAKKKFQMRVDPKALEEAMAKESRLRALLNNIRATLPAT